MKKIFNLRISLTKQCQSKLDIILNALFNFALFYISSLGTIGKYKHLQGHKTFGLS